MEKHTLDRTHAQQLESFVETANADGDFPIQNLPFGTFSKAGGPPRTGVAIGDYVLDLAEAVDAGLFTDEAIHAGTVAAQPPLNALLSLPAHARRALRQQLSDLLCDRTSRRDAVQQVLIRREDCRMLLPVAIGGYTDFYAGIHHATNLGRLFRPDSPLLPNYKYVPIAYHGRTSSILPSGVQIRRPNGQLKADGAQEPVFVPTRRLDYELELGLWIGPPNALGEPIPVTRAQDHIAGFCLLNDWSARDIQAWEYQPLGPFLSKNFATTISPWIVTAEALAPFRAAQALRPAGDPRPLPYLMDARDQAHGALDLKLEVHLRTQRMREDGMPPFRLSQATAKDLYWTPAQLVAHHTSNGCNLQAGDLCGTGTVSSAAANGGGSLLELTQGGRKSLALPSGESRVFLEDGDEVILRARAEAPGFRSIGFGECSAQVLPARPLC
jgi:fumarylacetoacetase